MKKIILFWIAFIIFCNIVMFGTCVIPWHCVIFHSPWFIFLSIPTTMLGLDICYNVFLYAADSDDEWISIEFDD